jgi:predicted branched-subunit amino acid permease
MTDIGYEGRASRPSETVAGFLAALAIFFSLISLAWHPLRLILPAILIALIAAAIGGRHRRLAFAAVMIAAACFFFGLTIAVVTSRGLW